MREVRDWYAPVVHSFGMDHWHTFNRRVADDFIGSQPKSQVLMPVVALGPVYDSSKTRRISHHPSLLLHCVER